MIIISRSRRRDERWTGRVGGPAPGDSGWSGLDVDAGEFEPGASGVAGGESDRPAVCTGQFVDDGESQSGAGFPGRVAVIENAVTLLWRDAAPVVRDVEPLGVRQESDGHRHRSVVVLDRVPEQVLEDVPQQVRVTGHDGTVEGRLEGRVGGPGSPPGLDDEPF